MKKKVLSYLLIALPALLLQSCLHDQEDKFSEASSLRLQEAIETAHKALYTNQTQWHHHTVDAIAVECFHRAFGRSYVAVAYYGNRYAGIFFR